MMDGSAKILFQSFMRKATTMSCSGACKQVHSMALSFQHFLCRPRSAPPSQGTRKNGSGEAVVAFNFDKLPHSGIIPPGALEPCGRKIWESDANGLRQACRVSTHTIYVYPSRSLCMQLCFEASVLKDPEHKRFFLNDFFQQTKQEKTCTFSRKSSFSSYVQHKNRKNKRLIQFILCRLDVGGLRKEKGTCRFSFILPCLLLPSLAIFCVFWIFFFRTLAVICFRSPPFGFESTQC